MDGIPSLVSAGQEQVGSLEPFGCGLPALRKKALLRFAAGRMIFLSFGLFYGTERARWFVRELYDGTS